MKILILIYLFFFSNFLLADYKMVLQNNKIHCVKSIKNNSETSVSIYHRSSSKYGFRNTIIEKEDIKTFETGYTGYDDSCYDNIVLYPFKYDLYNEVREINIDLPDSSFIKKLNNSKNIKKDMFVVQYDQAKEQSPICTDGTTSSTASGSSKKYGIHSPLNEIVYVDDFNSINDVFAGAKFNPDLNKCIYPDSQTPLSVKDYFKNSEAYSYNKTEITNAISSLKELLNTKEDLQNPNSLENKFDIDVTASSKDCNNSLYTLQEKLLCEMNAGLRKLNQESNPQYSLNNLVSILITSNNNNTEDINKTIKSISSFEEVRLEQQKNTNNLLNETNLKQNEVNENLLNINETLQQLNINTKDGLVSNGGTSGTVTPGETESTNLDEYLKPDETVNINNVTTDTQDTSSLIDSFFSIFTDFKTNINTSFITINEQLQGTKDLILAPQNIFNNVNIVNCPVSYDADFSSFGIGKKILSVDYCHYMSYLKPIIYFFTYVSLLLSLIFFTFRFIGVLL